MQAGGKSGAECEGVCDVDTGRLVGADYVVGGVLLRLGQEYKLTLKLYDVVSGQLLAGMHAAGATPEELEKQVRTVAPQLVSVLKPPPGPPPPWGRILLGTAVAAAGAGAYFGLQSRSAASDWQNAGTPGSLNAATWASARDSTTSNAGRANTAYVIAGGLAAIGAALFFTRYW